MPTTPQYNTQGGSRTFCSYSGTITDTMIFSGGGRLNVVVPHVLISGVAINLYDAALTVSGGPIPASGHKLIGTIPVNATPAPVVFNVSFQSGLAVNQRSGQPGFTVSYTPENPIF